jgi:hypothetical protein
VAADRVAVRESPVPQAPEWPREYAFQGRDEAAPPDALLVVRLAVHCQGEAHQDRRRYAQWDWSAVA